MIELSIWVTTDRFEVTTPGEHFINARCFGEDFALWLTPKLEAQGVSVSAPLQEDWSWLLYADYAAYRFSISIGVMEASLGLVPADWRVGILYSRLANPPRLWFKPEPFDLLKQVRDIVRRALEEEPSIKVLHREP